MIKRIFLLLLMVSFGFSKSYIFSSIPSVTNEVLDVDPSYCGIYCQERLLQQELPFSFLAKYNEFSDSPYLRNAYQELNSILNLEISSQEQTQEIRIAVLVPSAIIGRYANNVVDSVNSFLLSKNVDFSVKVFDSKREDVELIEEQISKISQDGFKYVIAPFTADGAEHLARLSLPFIVYVPTVNKNDVDLVGTNIVYGGIDYKAQIRALEKHIDSKKIVIFEEPAYLTRKISSFYMSETKFANPVIKSLATSKINFKHLFEELDIDKDTAIFLNTRPILTSLILSQLTYNDVNVSKIASTQLNFTSVVLRLAQSGDFKRLIVASSISNVSSNIYETNRFFNNDIAFDWVVYSSAIMTDIILQRSKKDFSSKSKSFGVEVFNNSLQYKTRIYKVFHKRFIEIAEE